MVAARAHRLIVAVATLFVVVGCDDGRNLEGKDESIFKPPTTKSFSEDDRKKVEGEIKELANGKDPSNPETSAAYDTAVRKLTGRGAGIETQLIDALAGSDDWAIRMGVIEVLISVATRASIDPLISRLDDPHPLVALWANRTLEVICAYKVIPSDRPTKDGLTPVPRRDPGNPNQLELDTEEKLWAQWHAANHKLLLASWRDWWSLNKGTAKIQ